MSEPRNPADQVGDHSQPVSEADTDDEYQMPEMGELEVRDTTGFSERLLGSPKPGAGSSSLSTRAIKTTRFLGLWILNPCQ